MAMKTTLTFLHSIPGKRGRKDFHEQTHTEVGLKETTYNLVGCFNDEAKANYQESPAVSIRHGGGRNGKGATY